MKGILADNNVRGHLDELLYFWQSDEWREIWDSLHLAVHSFRELGLTDTAPDDVIWQMCQQRQIALITANRNDEGPHSLEATIRNQNRDDSLPVFTLADANRIMMDRAYARRVAESLLDYLSFIERVRGAGRLYVP
jgi:hypothetical protein